MKTRVSILFWFRKDRLPASEKRQQPVALEPRIDHVTPERKGVMVCRITIGGKKTNFTFGVHLTYGQWDVKAEKIRGQSPGAVRGNSIIAKLRNDLLDIHADLERQRKPVTISNIMAIYRNNGSPLNVLDLYDAFLAERETLVGVEISPKTHEAALIRRKKLALFLTKHNALDLRPEEFRHNMADKFLHWLLLTQGFQRNTALKSVQMISQVFTWAIRREFLEKNPLALYKYKMAAPKDIEYLEKEELDIMTEAKMPVTALDKVRDCFLFQCYTGLAYADLAALDMQQHAEQHQGRRILRVRRAKSTMTKGYECVIPLLPEAERILSKYRDAIPVPSNQIYNRYLKQVGELCGLEKMHLTTHIGRKTAGVQMLNAGIPMEVVSRVLGHSSVRMTEKVYAKILDRTVVEAFDKVYAPPTPPAPAPGFEPQQPETGRIIQMRFGA